MSELGIGLKYIVESALFEAELKNTTSLLKAALGRRTARELKSDVRALIERLEGVKEKVAKRVLESEIEERVREGLHKQGFYIGVSIATHDAIAELGHAAPIDALVARATEIFRSKNGAT